MTTTQLLQTPLYNLHQQQQAKMVDFAGYALPVQYPLGVLKEHLHTREAAGLFDVSHMGQIHDSSQTLSMDELALALESVVPADLLNMPVGQQCYTFICNADGGLLDDLIIARLQDHFYLVVNAATKQQDLIHLRKLLPQGIELTLIPDHALLALQGPLARETLESVIRGISKLKFMQCDYFNFAGLPVLVACSGYTGEDGFEIAIENNKAAKLAEALLQCSAVKPIGLGARDSLRLEAGLCLYGQDIDVTINPVTANLQWAIAKSRRPGGERAGGYLGAEAIAQRLAQVPQRKRCLIKVDAKTPVRVGTEIVNADNQVIGRVTSGGFGPSVNHPVAMAYLDTVSLELPMTACVRNKQVPISVVRDRLIPNNYCR